MSHSLAYSENFPADVCLLRFAPRHHAARGRDVRPAHAAEHGRNVLGADIDTQSRLTDPSNANNRAFFADHLQLHLEYRRLVFLLFLIKTRDVAFALEHVRHFRLQMRIWDVDVRFARPVGIANPRQHVGDGIGYVHWITKL